MGVTINKKSATTEPRPYNGQQPKPMGGLNAFYWYQIFALDSAVVEVQEMFRSHGGHLTNATYAILKNWDVFFFKKTYISVPTYPRTLNLVSN